MDNTHGNSSLETARLRVNRLNIIDFSHQFNPATEPERCSFELDLLLFSQLDDGGALLLSATDKKTGLFVGACGLVSTSTPGEIEIGFRILKKYQLHGLGTELVGGLLRHCTNNLKLHDILACIDPGNYAAKKVVQRNDMVSVDCRSHYGTIKDCFKLIDFPVTDQ